MAENEFKRNFFRRIEEMLDEAREGPVRVLDLGCGEGEWCLFLAELGCQVVGVDTKLPQEDELDPRVNWYEASILPWTTSQLLRAAPFNVILLANVLEELGKRYTLGELLPLLAECLAPGGIIAISTTQRGVSRSSDDQGKTPYRLNELQPIFDGWDPIFLSDLPEATPFPDGFTAREWPTYLIMRKPDDE